MSVPQQAVDEILAVRANQDREEAARRLADANALRAEFVQRFPMAGWADLDLERYALGTDVEGGSACWWIEFKTKPVGSISGGSAAKHLLWRRPDGSWAWPTQYASVGEAWEAVRAGFVEMLQLAQQRDFRGAFEVAALTGAKALRMKTLYLYFPDDLLPIFNQRHLEHFFGRLGSEVPAGSSMDANRALLELLRSVPEFSEISNQELMFLLYAWTHPQSRGQIVKIAPGERGRSWDECLAGGYICVGWDDVGDLREFASKDEFRKAFRDAYPYRGNEAQVTRKSNEVWTLIELAPGDRVIANRGTTEVLGIGTVTDAGYSWRPDRDEMRHTVAVEWDTSHAGPIDAVKAWATTTVKKVPDTLYRSIVSGGVVAGTSVGDFEIDGLYREIEESLTRRGQVILFGPPGTGKTYAARRAGVWLLSGGIASSDAAGVLGDAEAFTRAEKRMSSTRPRRQQAWFMVANPSHWSWERLFEDGTTNYSFGRLQRNFPKVRAGDLVIGYSATPDKRVVALATVTGEYDPDAPDDKALTLEPLGKVANGVTYDELGADPLLAESEPMRMRCQGTLFALTGSEADRLLAELAQRDSRLGELIGAGVQRLTRVTFHPSYTYEDFVEGFRPQATSTGQLDLTLVDGVFKQVCLAAAAAPDQRFVVIIDEINRGNIPKILGELITLLEADKRGLTVRLPQSGDEFSVPPNVHIIGTMNTADRSIQLMDTALRRRFAFIELLPDTEALAGAVAGGLALDVFLDNLNERIRAIVGREKQIGHALFFRGGDTIDTAEEFAAVFRHELLPLLQEYLYESWGPLAELLGEVIVDEEAQRLTDVVADAEALCAALATQFGAAAAA
jgi:5-methylcytosine-specific restriction protein B